MIVADTGTWRSWWEFNKEAYLLDGESVAPLRPRSGPDGGFASRRPSDGLIRTRVLPVLLEILEQEPGQDLVNAALLSLGRIGERLDDELGSAEIAEVLFEHLKHRRQGVAENACVAIGVLAQPSSLPVLSALLMDSKQGRIRCGRRVVPHRMRAFAGYGLGLVAQRTKNPDVHRYAVQTLREALKDTEVRGEHEVACLIGLGMAGPLASTEATDDLTRFLHGILEDDDRNVVVRAHAATTLARLANAASAEVRAEAAGAMLDVLKSRRGRNEPRQSCAMALGLVGDLDEDELDRDIRRTLMRSAVKGNKLSQHFALLSLARIAGRRGQGEGDPLAGEAEIRSFLFERLARVKTPSRPWVAMSIGVMADALNADQRGLNSAERTAFRLGFDEHKSADLFGAFALGLGLSRDAQATGEILERIQDVKDPPARVQAALALGFLAEPLAIDTLRDLMREAKHQPELLEGIAIALMRLGDIELVAELLDLLEDCECLLSKTSVFAALGRTQDERAVEPLLTMVAEGTENQRAWAAHALGRVCDKDQLPWMARISSWINYRANPVSLTSPEGAGILDFN